MDRAMANEIERKAVNGIPALLVLVLAAAAAVWLFMRNVSTDSTPTLVGCAVLALFVVAALPGFFTVQPNQAQVLTLFGHNTGSVKTAGLWWSNPFFIKRSISLRVRNFETAKLKVNDKTSNPIEIGAIVV